MPVRAWKIPASSLLSVALLFCLVPLLAGCSAFGSRDRVEMTPPGIGSGLAGAAADPALNAIDLRRAVEAEFTALKFGLQGRPVVWQNPDTGNHGEVIAGAPALGTPPCREATHTLYVRGQSRSLSGRLCEQSDGTWLPSR